MVMACFRNIRYSKEAQRTVVVMPFLGGAMGAGHSELGNRFVYLQTCFWSLYEFFPHIVAGVARQEVSYSIFIYLYACRFILFVFDFFYCHRM